MKKLDIEILDVEAVDGKIRVRFRIRDSIAFNYIPRLPEDSAGAKKRISERIATGHAPLAAIYCCAGLDCQGVACDECLAFNWFGKNGLTAEERTVILLGVKKKAGKLLFPAKSDKGDTIE